MTATKPQKTASGSYPGRGLDPHIGPCPRWCQDSANGHRLQPFAVDRVHTGEVSEVPLALADMIKVLRGPDPVEYLPAVVEVQLRQQDREVGPAISLNIETDGKQAEATLSLAEAKRLVKVLTRLVALAEAAAALRRT